jgi:hypothetical protein
MILLPALSLYSTGQERCVQRFNFEIGGGMNFGAFRCGAERVTTGPTLFTEVRYNFRKRPVDVGLHFDASGFTRTIHGVDEAVRSMKMLVVGDYNFQHGRRVKSFVGVGVGNAHEDETSVAIVPRAGVKLWNHVSLTLGYEVSNKWSNHFDLKIGIYL